jgi:hypothetical protein
MGKKNRMRGREARALKPGGLNGATAPNGKRPRVLFAVGDADFAYTEGKIWRLVKRLKDHTGWNIVGVSHDRETLDEGKKLGLDVEYVAIESPGVSVQDRLLATDEMIRETADVMIPGSELPLWKVLAMDDFLCSLQLYDAQPSVPLQADAVIAPLMCIDNNTKATCGLYTWLVSEARKRGIPVIGLEVSPLGNKNTLSQLPADHYVVKTKWSKDFLARHGLARREQVSVLRWEESYLLWPAQEEYTESYLAQESKAREMLNVPWDRFTVLIPHHVAFLWEVRKVLEALAGVQGEMSVVIRVDARTIRRHYHEREIVVETYGKEIHALPHVVIDERVGIGLLLQVADLVIAPFAGTTTERATLCRKPTIICQAMGEEGWRGEFLYCEPRPEKIPELIRSWRQEGRLERARLARVVSELVDAAAKAAA